MMVDDQILSSLNSSWNPLNFSLSLFIFWIDFITIIGSFWQNKNGKKWKINEILFFFSNEKSQWIERGYFIHTLTKTCGSMFMHRMHRNCNILFVCVMWRVHRRQQSTTLRWRLYLCWYYCVNEKNGQQPIYW